MQLGKFSVSLSVQSLSVSRAFYEKLGFQHIAGEEAHRYLILQNGEATIGLFEGMFEGNILTFNPGWGPQGEELEDFEDVRVLQAKLEEAGIQLTEKADPNTSGPAHVTLIDPDGNAILLDQHR
jgi:catechol 2,3-dioxygenase-like lactoylglutathione lyase family enzyme